MNTDKEKAQRMIVQSLKGIELSTAQAVKAKDTFRAKIANLKKAAQTFTNEHIESEIKKLEGNMRAAMAEAHAGIDKSLDELRTLLRDRDAALDLSNPAMTNALSLIQTMGGNLTFEEAQKINANFPHDQSALRTLKAAYHARGIVSTGGIDGLIYNADDEIANVKRLAFEGLVNDGNINKFASKLNTVAKLEGTTIEQTPDQQGATDATRQAAGLPV